MTNVRSRPAPGRTSTADLAAGPVSLTTGQSMSPEISTPRVDPRGSELSPICAQGDGNLFSVAGPLVAPYRPMTLADLALALRDAADQPAKQLWVSEFLEDFRWEPAEVKATLIVDRPLPTGDQRYDALLGALAEHLAYHE